jgi:protein-tyrosine phosphatase
MNDFDRILSAPAPLYLGRFPTEPAHHNVECFVNLCGELPHAIPNGVATYVLPLKDTLEPDLKPRRKAIEQFLAAIHEHVKVAPSYWHCHAGLNRAGFALSAYLHLYHDFKISDAIALLREKRSEYVLCNSNFEGILRDWYGTADEKGFTPTDDDVYYQRRDG